MRPAEPALMAYPYRDIHDHLRCIYDAFRWRR